MGDRSKEDGWVIAESEFSSWDPRDFDKFTPLSGWSLGNKDRASQHSETWKANTTNLPRRVSLIYGSQWLGERLNSIEKFRPLQAGAPANLPWVSYGTLGGP